MSAAHEPIRLLISGARGRMGERLEILARQDANFRVVAAIDRDDPPRDAPLDLAPPDVIIDFSSDEGAARAAALASRFQAALLVGTTALSPRTHQTLDALAAQVPVLLAANTSLGVAVLNHLAVQAAKALGPEYSIDLIEHHHALKTDAPSGTALRLAESLRAHAGVPLPPERIHAVRAGDIVGEHTVQFAGPGERITITHAATSRDLFVRGALRAAAWLKGKTPGRYAIEQTLGLES